MLVLIRSYISSTCIQNNKKKKFSKVQHCPHRLDIWAHPSHADGLDGLCGHFNYYVLDDFEDRSGIVHALEKWPWEFPVSWKASRIQCLQTHQIV